MFKNNPESIKINFFSLSIKMAVLMLILFPVLGISSGLNGFLAQFLFSMFVFMGVFWRCRFSKDLLYTSFVILIFYLGLFLSYLIKFESVDLADWAQLLRVIVPICALFTGFYISRTSPKFFILIFKISIISVFSIHFLVMFDQYIFADIWYYRDSSELNSIRSYYHIYRASGFFGYPSEAALVIIFLFVAIVGCTDTRESALIFYLMLTILAIVLTQSRVGLGFLAIVLFLFFYYSRKKLMLSVMPILLFPVLSNMAFSYFYGSFTESVESSNIAIRASEFSFFTDNFFNDKLSSLNVNKYREVYGTLESYYLTLLLRGGKFAVFSEVITQLTLLIYLFLIKVETRNLEFLKWFSVFTIFLNVTVLNFFSGVLLQGKSAVIIWILIGAFIGLSKVGCQLSNSVKTTC